MIEDQHLTITSPTTPTTTFSSTPHSSSSEVTTSTSTSTTPILARANLISSSSTNRSVVSTTTTTETTTKPSAKRQISLNEFQKLVAKVNDEISMLRNQSANLSQTYEELVRRYNERTSQIPIVLYDVTECSNGTTALKDSSMQANTAESISVSSAKSLTEVTDSTVTSKRTTTPAEITNTTSTTNAPSSTTVVEYSAEKFNQPEALADHDSSTDAVPQHSGSSNTQIYGNKYYNYIHYFMYPPSEEQLEDMNNPSHVNHRRKGGNDMRKVGPTKQRKEDSYRKRNPWEGQIDSWEDSEERELAEERPAFRRRTPERTGENRSNLRGGPIAPHLPFGVSIPANGGPYHLGGSLQGKSTEIPRIPQYSYVEERIPPRVLPSEGMFASIGGSHKQTPLETVSKVPAYMDKISAFLERRNIYRNGPIQSTTNAPTRQVTSSSTVASEPVTLPSFESLLSFGVKPVNYSIPSTTKPLAGLVRNGWDGHDFSFVRKAQETKKRLQREQRSSRKEMRDL
uniref:Uncharacterized protein n=1 Tax=Anopheles funestus TaxID=62324 RepID=A0A182S3E5_ANOFN